MRSSQKTRIKKISVKSRNTEVGIDEVIYQVLIKCNYFVSKENSSEVKRFIFGAMQQVLWLI
jgi:hypothetical protein